MPAQCGNCGSSSRPSRQPKTHQAQMKVLRVGLDGLEEDDCDVV